MRAAQNASTKPEPYCDIIACMHLQSIYLDCNATAPLLPEVADAMREAALCYQGNPESQHEPGRQARRALESARQRIGELVGARTAGMDADRVVLTSGGTEANNLALFGLRGPQYLGEGRATANLNRRLLVSSIEHPSVARAAEQLAAREVQVDQIAVDSDGVTNLDHVAELIARNPPPTLVSVMLANNETGVIQPVAEIAALAGARDLAIHTDAVQAAGKIPVDFTSLGVDAMTIAAHKLHGPLGIGALVLRNGVELSPQMFGGFQQASLRPGTESVALAVGFAAALEAWHGEAKARADRLRALRDSLESTIRSHCPDVVVIGASADRLPNTSNIAFVGLDRQALAMALDLAGVACSTGSACASGSSEPSPALLAMGLPESQIRGSIRFSFGAQTTATEAAEAARRIISVCNKLRRA